MESNRMACQKTDKECPLGCIEYCKMAAKAPKGIGDLPKGVILIEDRDVYDGWCAYYNPKTDEFVFRDAWFTNRLSQTRKDAIEFGYRKTIGQEMPKAIDKTEKP